MKRRVLSLILCVFLCLTMLPAEIFAASLPAMNVKLTGDVLSWDPVDGAVEYSIAVANGGGFMTGTSTNLKDRCNSYGTSAGEKNYTVYAIDENGRRITEKMTGTYNYVPLGTLATPTNITWQSGFKAGWTAVPNAESYSVILYRMDYIGGPQEKVATYSDIKTNSIDFTKTGHAITGGTVPPFEEAIPGAYYMASVKAVSKSGYAPSAYGKSNFQQLVPGTVNEIQNITLIGNTLSWSAYPGATCYEILFGNGGSTVFGTSLNLKEKMDYMGMKENDYQIVVVAESKELSEGGQRISLKTNGPIYKYKGNGPLAAPTGLYWDGFTAKWNEVPNADNYYVTVSRLSDGEVFRKTTVNADHNYLDMGTPIPGESYLFTVEAKSSHGYSASPVSSSSWLFFPMTYSVTCTSVTNGTLRADVKKAEEGQLVTVTATPSSNYYCTGITVDGTPISGNTFFMPAHAVTVSASFAAYSKISTVECNIAIPVDGELPAKVITVPADANYTAVISSITKDGEEYTGPVVGGDHYYYKIVFTAKAGFGFTENVGFYLNGEYLGLYGGNNLNRTIFTYITAGYVPLSGAISVTGELKYGEKLTAAWSGDGNASFSWYVDDESVAGNSETFSINYEKYIGKELKIVATAPGYSGEVRQSLGIIGKANGPAAPVLKYTKPTSTGASDGTIDTSSNMEWTTNLSGSWTACTDVMTGLSAGTYYVRVAESSTSEAGDYAVISIPDGNGTILSALAFVEQPVIGVTTSDIPTAGDITYQVSLDPRVDNYDNFKIFYLAFTAEEGYQFSDSTVFTLNGLAVNITNKISNGQGGYRQASGYLRIDKIKLPITGTVNVSGTGEHEKYLTANLSGSNANNPQYCWYVDGEETSYFSSSFLVSQDHLGKQITVRVTDSAREGYIESAPVLGIKKKNHYEAPQVEVYSKPSVTGAADGIFFSNSFYYGYQEYSADGVNWTKIPEGNVYLSAAAGTYYFRHVEEELYEAGEIATAIMPEADTLITFASCTIETPVDGLMPATAVTVPLGANYTVTVNSCKNISDYSPVTGTFEAPNYYQYELKFTAKPGYKLQYDGPNATDIKINGTKVTASGYGSFGASSLSVRVTYRCSYTQLVGTLEIAGDPVLYNTVTASLSGDNASGTLTYKWYLDGVYMGTGESFPINSSTYIGRELTAELTDSEHSGKLTSPGVTVYEKGMTKLPTPAVSFAASGPDKGMLYGFGSTYKYAYKIDSGEWQDVVSSAVDLTGLSACTISVKCVGNGIDTVDSDSQIITVTKAATPMLTAVQPKDSGDFGSITGVTSDMQYKRGESGLWTDCPDGKLENLGLDTYYVRVKASGTTLASEMTALVIELAPNRFDEVELGLGQDLRFRIYCTLETENQGATLRATDLTTGKAATITGELQTSGKMLYVFRVMATDMSHNYMFELTGGAGEVLARVEKYSVKSYCQQVAEDYHDNKTVMSLIADLLNYGASLQIFRNDNTENLPNTAEWIPAAQSSFTPVTDEMQLVNNSLSNAAWIKSAYLNITDVIKICFRVQAKNTDNLKAKLYKITSEGESLKMERVILSEEEIISTDEIFAADMTDSFRLELYKDDVLFSSVTYNIKSYVARMQTEDAPALKDVCQKMWMYALSAKNYPLIHL